MKNNDISIGGLGKSLQGFTRKLSRYSFIFFLLFLAAIYGFVLYRVNSLAAADPDDETTTQITSKTPHIDKHVVTQLEDLKDNSVSVQTLFDEARNNPFNE